MHPLVSFTFGVPCGVPFSLDAGKGKCCMWHVNKVEIYLSKIGFVNSKWSNLNVPGSYTPWCHPPLGFTVGCPFLCMQEREMLHVSVNKVEIHFTKLGFMDCIWPNLIAPGSYTPLCHSLLGSTVECPFLWMQEKRKCCMRLVNKVEIYWAKIGFVDSNFSN